MKIIYQNLNKIITYCPFHNDKGRPNLHITLNDPYYGHYRCFACGKHGVLNSGQLKRLKIMKKKRKRDKPVSPDWKSLAVEYFMAGTAESGLAKEWGVKVDTVRDYLCGWDGDAYTFPMYNAKEEVIGIQRRWLDGRKMCIQDSKLGLFLPSQEIKGSTLFITEGVSDACSVHDLGFDVIARPSASSGKEFIIKWLLLNSGWDEKKKVYIGIEHVVIVPDKDVVGLDGANDLQNEIIDHAKHVYSTVVNTFGVMFLWPKDVKDIRGLIKVVGKDVVRKELENYVSYRR